ncbi:MAG: LamG domain-containing protein, partial [Desulfobacteraceae bacterium]|nr:LamG domain-containing protein [Desulfobacteraceae bacterium]
NGYVHYAWRPHWYWDGGTAFTISANTWTYVTLVYDGYYQTLYKDGVQVYSREQTGSMGSNSSKLLIGARGSGNPRNFFGGKIDEVRIYDRGLAENEIVTAMNETRECTESVIISTTTLVDGTIASAYSSALSVSGGTAPYAWTIVTNPFSGITLDSLSGSTVNLTGTIAECAGDYDIVIKATDDNSNIDQRTFTVTVNNGTLTIAPAAPQTFTAADGTFEQHFTISGPRDGIIDNWAITWLSADPTGVGIISTGDATAKIYKTAATSAINNGYLFRISARDADCNDNTITSGTYTLDVTGN